MNHGDDSWKRLFTRACRLLALLGLVGAWHSSEVGAETPASTTEAAGATEDGSRRPFPPREATSARRVAPRPDLATGGSWWLGSAGAALALGGLGWASIGARRHARGASPGGADLRVVGRASLSPKHSVYLLQAGGRVLLVGTGPQGPPSLLGEIADSSTLDEAADEPDPAARPRLDLRLGDAS